MLRHLTVRAANRRITDSGWLPAGAQEAGTGAVGRLLVAATVAYPKISGSQHCDRHKDEQKKEDQRFFTAADDAPHIRGSSYFAILGLAPRNYPWRSVGSRAKFRLFKSLNAQAYVKRTASFESLTLFDRLSHGAKVFGLPSRRRLRPSPAKRPNSISRVNA